MGVVYRATQVSLGRRVALKVIATPLAEQEGFRERFQRESRLAASLDHPNVIPVYAAGEHEGVVYIAMRYVEGTDLRALIAAKGALEPAQAALIVAQVAWALDYAHAHGLVHRDVKPANILVTASGSREHVYLTDFGLTKRSASESRLTAAGQWVGTVDYVAPEQLRGESVDGRADVYALGCVLYEALTGRVPFPRDNELAKLWGHISDRPTSASKVAREVPDGLARVCQRAMAKKPGDRYATAGELGNAALAATPPQRPEPARTGPLAGLPRPALAAVGGVVVLALAAGVLAAARGRGGGDSGREPRRPQVSSAAGAVVGKPVRVGDAPTGVAVGAGSVWVADTGDEDVTRIDAATGRVRGRPIRVGEDPGPVAVGAGAVWVVNQGDGTVDRIDPRSGRVAGAPIRVGRDPTDAAVASGDVWVSTELDRVVRIDPRLNRVVGRPIRVGAGGALALGSGRLWVCDRKDGTVRSVDTRSGLVVDTPVPIGAGPSDLAIGPGDVWVAVADDRAVKRIALGSGAERRPTRTGGRPELLALRGNALWVADVEGESVSRIDVRSGRLVGRPIRVGEDPAGMAVGAKAVWVTSEAEDTVTRIRPG